METGVWVSLCVCMSNIGVMQYLYHDWTNGGPQLKAAFLEHENTSIIDACSCKRQDKLRRVKTEYHTQSSKTPVSTAR